MRWELERKDWNIIDIYCHDYSSLFNMKVKMTMRGKQGEINGSYGKNYSEKGKTQFLCQ